VTRLGAFSPIGPIFYSGRFFEKDKISPNFCATFSRDSSCVLILTQHGLGYILGEFFTNSSGQPASGVDIASGKLNYCFICWIKNRTVFWPKFVMLHFLSN
jgi:hypothetical protein